MAPDTIYPKLNKSSSDGEQNRNGSKPILPMTINQPALRNVSINRLSSFCVIQALTARHHFIVVIG